jgi:hypothetical protein
MPRVNWRQTRNDHRHLPRNGNGDKSARAARPAAKGSHRQLTYTKP